ncbi:hypothetical protein FSP39_006417 [Pinctada imbricata]|uniref:RNase H type-1 domain-containing protein n=1 Tax=Pinctada imbricata TaxID=66713 RepID=A0AA88XUH7_PINIB|nr:hypothetical protein FSP39_006417 [Pinctada imbricata]
MQLWLTFLRDYNGSTYFPERDWDSNSTLHLFTNSAENAKLGCRAILGNHWVNLKWPEAWESSKIIREITFLELVPIALAISIWGNVLKNRKIIFHIDNEALVNIINCQTSKSRNAMTLLRPLILALMKSNITFKAVHIEGAKNNAADALSRFQWSRFRQEMPGADTEPTSIPTEFLNLLWTVK